MNKERRLSIILIFSSAILTFIVIATGQFAKEKYTVEIGQIAPKTEYAPREIPNKIATENKKEQIANSLDTQYVIDPSVGENSKESVELLFNYIHASQSSEVSKYGVRPIEILKDRSPIPLYTEQYELMLKFSNKEREELEEEILRIVDEIYSAGISVEAEDKALNSSDNLFRKTDLNPDQIKVGSEIISLIIRPNMVEDSSATDELIEETVKKVEPVMVLPGETIVVKGTRVTEETYELLKEAGYIKEEVTNSIKRYVGIIIIIFLLLGMYYSYMLTKRKEIKVYRKEKMLLFALYIISLLTIRIVGNIKFVYIPMTIAPMLVAILIGSDIAIMLNIIIVIVGSLVYKGDLSYILYFLITGTVSALSVVNIKQRNKILTVATYIGTVNALVIASLRLFIEGTIGMSLVVEAGVAFLIGNLMLIIVVGSLPFWEIAFDIVTPIKLLELTNPDQELLKRLLLEATGTYHHSLLVANLAETAAYDIGANPLLARVGGYYHDIGKLEYVNYYKENQVGENPHDYLDPDLSAAIILNHVKYGKELAVKNNLPKQVQDIIAQHHGTSLVKYFYVEACNNKEEGQEEILKADYQYIGPKPQTREAALVMLADVVEATVRSMMPFKDKEQTLEATVEKIVKGKLEEGQLDESELKIKDIDIIIGSFNKLLAGMYHERITYPTIEEV